MNAEVIAKKEIVDPFSENTEAMARAVLVAIEALEMMCRQYDDDDAKRALATIRGEK